MSLFPKMAMQHLTALERTTTWNQENRVKTINCLIFELCFPFSCFFSSRTMESDIAVFENKLTMSGVVSILNCSVYFKLLKTAMI